ncbi:deoxyribose-phosphate aldolase [Pectinatus sottacetonis]|uniref:deoxyribose-phosphate aldolase n=1 Tax=Pectinatus sottacetonis TaxID=1002795 RepID=UPI0018C770A4|nr:deoxyribose-phosphate aldolase [Pectinatus sottacetonis]
MLPSKPAKEMSKKELAKYIDYSVLKPEFTKDHIVSLTQDGVEKGCATICINPGYIELCEPYTAGSETMLCPVCDFPFGASSTESKVQQIKIAAGYDSVKEVDIVANFGWIRSGLYDAVTEEIKECAKACHKYGRELKVILETDALNETQIRKACQCCIAGNTDFVKTSTGFLTGYDLQGASIDVIKILIEEVRGRCKIKGSGCIRTQEHFFKLIDMGIDRVGIGYKSVPIVLGEK